MSIGGGKRTKIAYSQMAATYGKDFAESIKHAPMQEWYGPVNSKLGLHYLKKLALHEPELPPFEQIEDYLRQDYTFRKTRDLQEQKIIELARQFNIIVEGEPYTF